MALEHHDGQRELQDRFDTRRLAGRLGDVAGTTFSDELAAFGPTCTGRSPVFTTSTSTRGRPSSSGSVPTGPRTSSGIDGPLTGSAGTASPASYRRRTSLRPGSRRSSPTHLP